MKWLITCILLLTFFPVSAHASSNSPSMREWHAYVKLMANKYDLDPNLCAALAAGESGKGKKEVRFCWVAKSKKYPEGLYHAPYNLHRSFLKRWDITDWKVNTEVGISTLARKIKKHGSLRAALRKYNTGDGPAQFNLYYKNILKLQRQYEARKVFEDATLVKK